MMQPFKTLFRSFFILILPMYSIFFVACEEEPSGIGIDLKLPDQRLDVFFSDTNKIQAYTFTQDSIRSDEPIYSLLGTINDPVFGTADPSFILHILLSEKLYPGENVKVDSLIFIIKPYSFYGDETSEFTLNIYQSLTRIYQDSMYYSNMDVSDSIGINPVGTTNYLPGDSIIMAYLDPTFGEWLLSDTSALVSQSAFQDHFNGFYLTANEFFGGTGAITNMDMISAVTRVSLYYSNSEEDSLFYEFDINSSTAKINLFDHDLSTADDAFKINHLNDNIEDTVSYIQGIGGVYTKLTFPFCETWKDSMPLAVNQAEIILSLYDTSSIQEFLPANEYDLLVKDEEGQFVRIFDNFLGASYFGGVLDDGEIRFNIATHLQDYLEDKNDQNEFYLFVKSQAFTPNRSILTSSLNSKNLKFKFTYTRLSE